MTTDIASIRSGNTAAAASKLRLLTLDSIDRRCRASRRVRDLIAALELEAGGADTLSASDRQLIQRAAITGAVLEDLEARMLAGDESVDPLVLATLGNTQRRALEAVGLKRDSSHDDAEDGARLIENYRAVANAKASDEAA